jgi:putative membrane protein
MSTQTTSRKPRAFDPEDADLRLEDAAAEQSDATAGSGRQVPVVADIGARLRWGAVLLSALAGLAVMAASLWAWNLVATLFARQDWIGWTALVLALIAAFAALMLVARELVGLLRLRRIASLQASAEQALATADATRAQRCVRAVGALYAGRKELAWARTNLARHERDVLDARERLALADRELMSAVDALARAAVATSAKRVAVVTALSPAVAIDLLYVLYENLCLLRTIAALYGGRPGLVGLYRLGGHVLTHIIATGGAALTDDLLHQFVGQSLAARLSGRLGQGLFNGALTARVGIAAMTVSRPLPFIETRKPRFRELVAEVAQSLRGKARAE